MCWTPVENYFRCFLIVFHIIVYLRQGKKQIAKYLSFASALIFCLLSAVVVSWSRPISVATIVIILGLSQLRHLNM